MISDTELEFKYDKNKFTFDKYILTIHQIYNNFCPIIIPNHLVVNYEAYKFKENPILNKLVLLPTDYNNNNFPEPYTIPINIENSNISIEWFLDEEYVVMNSSDVDTNLVLIDNLTIIKITSIFESVRYELATENLSIRLNFEEFCDKFTESFTSMILKMISLTQTTNPTKFISTNCDIFSLIDWMCMLFVISYAPEVFEVLFDVIDFSKNIIFHKLMTRTTVGVVEPLIIKILNRPNINDILIKKIGLLEIWKIIKQSNTNLLNLLISNIPYNLKGIVKLFPTLSDPNYNQIYDLIVECRDECGSNILHFLINYISLYRINDYVIEIEEIYIKFLKLFVLKGKPNNKGFYPVQYSVFRVDNIPSLFRFGLIDKNDLFYSNNLSLRPICNQNIINVFELLRKNNTISDKFLAQVLPYIMNAKLYNNSDQSFNKTFFSDLEGLVEDFFITEKHNICWFDILNTNMYLHNYYNDIPLIALLAFGNCLEKIITITKNSELKQAIYDTIKIYPFLLPFRLEVLDDIKYISDNKCENLINYMIDNLFYESSEYLIKFLAQTKKYIFTSNMSQYVIRIGDKLLFKIINSIDIPDSIKTNPDIVMYAYLRKNYHNIFLTFFESNVNYKIFISQLSDIIFKLTEISLPDTINDEYIKIIDLEYLYQKNNTILLDTICTKKYWIQSLGSICANHTSMMIGCRPISHQIMFGESTNDFITNMIRLSKNTIVFSKLIQSNYLDTTISHLEQTNFINDLIELIKKGKINIDFFEQFVKLPNFNPNIFNSDITITCFMSDRFDIYCWMIQNIRQESKTIKFIIDTAISNSNILVAPYTAMQYITTLLQNKYIIPQICDEYYEKIICMLIKSNDIHIINYIIENLTDSSLLTNHIVCDLLQNLKFQKIVENNNYFRNIITKFISHIVPDIIHILELRKKNTDHTNIIKNINYLIKEQFINASDFVIKVGDKYFIEIISGYKNILYSFITTYQISDITYVIKNSSNIFQRIVFDIRFASTIISSLNRISLIECFKTHIAVDFINIVVYNLEEKDYHTVIRLANHHKMYEIVTSYIINSLIRTNIYDSDIIEYVLGCEANNIIIKNLDKIINHIPHILIQTNSLKEKINILTDDNLVKLATLNLTEENQDILLNRVSWINNLQLSEKVLESIKFINSPIIQKYNNFIMQNIKHSQKIYNNFIGADNNKSYICLENHNNDWMIGWIPPEKLNTQNIIDFVANMGSADALNKRGQYKIIGLLREPFIKYLLESKQINNLFSDSQNSKLSSIIFNNMIENQMIYNQQNIWNYIRDLPDNIKFFIDKLERNILMLVLCVSSRYSEVEGLQLIDFLNSLSDEIRNKMLNDKDYEGNNLIFYATRYAPHIIQYIIGYYTSDELNYTNYYAESLLMWAIRYNHAAAHILIEAYNISDSDNIVDIIQTTGCASSYSIIYYPEIFDKISHTCLTNIFQAYMVYDWISDCTINVNLRLLELAAISNPQIFKKMINSTDCYKKYITDFKIIIGSNEYNFAELVFLYQPQSFQYLLGSKYAKCNLKLRDLENIILYQPWSWYILLSNNVWKEIESNHEFDYYSLPSNLHPERIHRVSKFIQTKNEVAVEESEKCEICLIAIKKIMFGCLTHMGCVGCAAKTICCPSCRNEGDSVKIFY